MLTLLQCVEGLRLMSPHSAWSNDLDCRWNGFSNLPERTPHKAEDFSGSRKTAMVHGDDSGDGLLPVTGGFDTTSGFCRVMPVHACRSTAWIHLFCARSTGVRPESSTTVTSAFRRSRTDVECSWPSCAFNQSNIGISGWVFWLESHYQLNVMFMRMNYLTALNNNDVKSNHTVGCHIANQIQTLPCHCESVRGPPDWWSWYTCKVS